MDRVFPPIKSTKNQPSPFITTKTVAYIFALIIDSVTLYHTDGAHSSAIQYEATTLQALDEMPTDEFWTDLRDSLISFYEGVLKVPGAGGRPQAKIIKHRFAAKPATGAQANTSDTSIVPAASADGSHSRAPTPVPAPAAAEEQAAAPEPPTAAEQPVAAKGKGNKSAGKTSK